MSSKVVRGIKFPLNIVVRATISLVFLISAVSKAESLYRKRQIVDTFRQGDGRWYNAV